MAGREEDICKLKYDKVNALDRLEIILNNFDRKFIQNK